MNFYIFLSRFSYLKSYKSKLMIVAFAGTHIPLVTLLFYFISSTAVEADAKLKILVIALFATLIATAATLLALYSLLSPIGLTARALQSYRHQKQLPTLPTQYTDDAGVLMASTSQILHQLDKFLHYVENYDNLTGLPNRKLLKSQLQKEILEQQKQSSKQQIEFFIIDIDSFKDLNAVEGTDVGDRLLRAIAHRLLTYTGNKFCLARLGSDEFALIQHPPIQQHPTLLTPDADTLQTTAQTLLNLIAQPYAEIKADICVTANIGIATYPTDGESADTLIANAYTALQQAKQSGHGRYQFYSADLAKAQQKRLKFANDLRLAIEKDQLLVHYQPRVDWRSGKIVGVECLARWQHPELGMVSPATFIPIAEETGLIVPIGEWILHKACAQNKAWQQAGLPNITVAVNLSARQIEDTELVNFVQMTLSETGLAADFLELEVTESLLIGDIEHTLSVLEALHDQGIALALDDFGTGYSSLSYLRKFPFDILKIDRSFVRDMVHSADAAEVIRAIVALAQGLRLELIAEGIETEAQLEQIKTYNCHEIQGYYYSRPLPTDQMTELLKMPNPWRSKVEVDAIASNLVTMPALTSSNIR